MGLDLLFTSAREMGYVIIDSVTICGKQGSMSRIGLSERTAIEAGIYAKYSFEEMGKKIDKAARFISEEIRRNRTLVQGEKPNGKDCVYAGECKRHELCGKPKCTRRCAGCSEADCRTLCSRYDSSPCSLLSRPPYVCNVCQRRRKCKADRAYYIAQQADAAAKRRYSIARSGPQIRGTELEALNQLVTPLIKRGQPLTHIFSEHQNEIPVSQRTLYHYIDSGLLSAGNLDLRRKVGYRPRKKKQEPTDAFLNQKYRKDRTYEDFLAYLTKHPELNYVEMDTVKGCREQGKRMLTMLFVEQNLMLILLMRDGKADTVVEQFDWLTSLLGLDVFQTLFPVILTDNGSEFKHTQQMELTVDGAQRTRLFYCDPQASWQKPHIEKNHEYIRYVLPKGKSFSPYAQDDITILVNHINSTKRAQFNGKAPYELIARPEFQTLMEALGLQMIKADEVNLTPRLLRRK